MDPRKGWPLKCARQTSSAVCCALRQEKLDMVLGHLKDMTCRRADWRSEGVFMRLECWRLVCYLLVRRVLA
jgi:hypothetical protein